MPNILAHNYVTFETAQHRTPDTVVGSVLPVFAAMYRDSSGEHVSYRRIEPKLNAGIDIHDRIVRTYDDQSEVPKMIANLTAHLESIGLKPDAAQRSSHLLADVMLDAALYEQRDPNRAYVILSAYVLGGQTALHNGNFPPAFIEMIETYFLLDVPAGYVNPKTIAEITQKRLGASAAHRWDHGRIIKDDQLEAVADVIDLQFERVKRLGTAALNRTINLISDSPEAYVPAE